MLCFKKPKVLEQEGGHGKFISLAFLCSVCCDGIFVARLHQALGRWCSCLLLLSCFLCLFSPKRAKLLLPQVLPPLCLPVVLALLSVILPVLCLLHIWHGRPSLASTM